MPDKINVDFLFEISSNGMLKINTFKQLSVTLFEKDLTLEISLNCS